MAILKLVAQFAEIIADLIRADGDALKEHEALMRAQEVAKAELDRRAFGGTP